MLIRTKGRSFTFSERKRKPTLGTLRKKGFTHGLAYLVDIFNHMNEIHLSAQGPEVTIVDANEKLYAFLANFEFCFHAVYVQLWLLFTRHSSLLTLHVSA